MIFKGLKKLLKSLNLFEWIFESSGKRILKTVEPIVKKINELEPEIQKLTQEEMIAKMNQWTEDFANKKIELDDILIEVFAIIREVALRTIKKRHFDVQLTGGYVIFKKMIAEMKTGEGKTLVATLPAILNSIASKQVFVVTVNDYLAKRDCELLRPVYEYLGVSVNSITSTCDHYKKLENYKSDVVYVTNNDLCFDYLRDNMAKTPEEKLIRHMYCAIIDEIDNILIDEARTPLIISGPDNDNFDLYNIINPLISGLDPIDYELDLKNKTIQLNNTGFDKIIHALNSMGVISDDLFSNNISCYHIVSNLLKAHKIMLKDKDYIVYNDEVIIIDEFTGRLAFGRKFSNGLHQALEAKEHVTVKQGSKTTAFTSYTNFFRAFDRIGGMTGTGLLEVDEFDEIYNLPVVPIPTNRVILRKDDSKIKLYQTKHDMYEDAALEIKVKYENGQPVLVGTPSVFESEIIAEYLDVLGLPYNLLNAKTHEQEVSIISQAGSSKAITIATSMAGRGTDIILGGCVESTLKDILSRDSSVDIHALEEELIPKYAENRNIVLKAGGLCVFLLGALDSRKSELQFIGRAGRQGDPGESSIAISLEDDLLLPLFRDAINKFFIQMFFNQRCNTNKKATSLLREIQETYQESYFQSRKNTLKYDDVINEQRSSVYKFRDYIMTCGESKIFANNIILQFFDRLNVKNKMDRVILEEVFEIENLEGQNPIAVDRNEIIKMVEEKVESNELNLNLEILNIFDENWFVLINELEKLKKTIHLVAYEQKDPVFEFRKIAFSIFKDFINRFQFDVSKMIIKNEKFENDMNSVFKSFESQDCFCGSGKEFRECHGLSLIEKNLEEKSLEENMNNSVENNNFDFQDNNLEDFDEDFHRNFQKMLKNFNLEEEFQRLNKILEENSLQDFMKNNPEEFKEILEQNSNNQLDNNSNNLLEPQSVEPQSVQPQSVQPQSVEPQSVQPQFVQPQFVQPQFVQPQSVEPQSVEPSVQPVESQPIESNMKSYSPDLENTNNFTEKPIKIIKSKLKSKVQKSIQESVQESKNEESGVQEQKIEKKFSVENI